MLETVLTRHDGPMRCDPAFKMGLLAATLEAEKIFDDYEAELNALRKQLEAERQRRQDYTASRLESALLAFKALALSCGLEAGFELPNTTFCIAGNYTLTEAWSQARNAHVYRLVYGASVKPAPACP